MQGLQLVPQPQICNLLDSNLHSEFLPTTHQAQGLKALVHFNSRNGYRCKIIDAEFQSAHRIFCGRHSVTELKMLLDKPEEKPKLTSAKKIWRYFRSVQFRQTA